MRHPTARFALSPIGGLSVALLAATLLAMVKPALPTVVPIAEVVLTGTPGAKRIAPSVASDSDTPRLRAERASMIRQQIEARGIKAPSVLAALDRVPRHLFVDSRSLSSAYGDHPLSIGHGQTISQPFIVGLMTELLRIRPDDTVLEVGTGSGYQAAVLAELAKHVVTIEIVAPLAQTAASRLERLGYRNITVLSGDGYAGWEPHAPYDGIIVTAAPTHVPPALVAQLKPGGRMVIPVGHTPFTQNLMLIEKDAAGKTSTRNVSAVRFVPMVRER